MRSLSVDWLAQPGALLLLDSAMVIHPGNARIMKDRLTIRLTSAEELSKINPWVIMGFIAIPVFVGSLDLTVVSAFLPELVSELGLPFDTGLR